MDVQGVRIAHVSSVHKPYDSRIFLKECRSLANRGYNVYYVVRHEKDEMIDGVNIVGIEKRKGRLARMFRTVWDIYGKTLIINPQIVHFHDPELIPIGLLFHIHGKKVIYDVHEDLPRQILAKNYIHSLFKHPMSWMASILEWVSTRTYIDRVVVVTEKIAKRFPQNKTILLQNYPLLDELVCDEPAPYRSRPNNVIYVGGISRIRGALDNIKAFEKVKDESCRFVLVGGFESTAFEQECRRMKGWGKVDYLGWLDRSQVRASLDSSRIGLVLFHPVPNHIEAQPNKLFEYMSAGIPVIASDFPLWRRIVETAGCGILVDPKDSSQIATAIDRLIENENEAEQMGKAGRKAVLEGYNWAYEERKLIGLYEGLE